MSYRRVIPRDLFNEANLLKCMGALYIALDEKVRGHRASWGEAEDGLPSFDVTMSMDDGSLIVANMPLIVDGARYDACRPMNSREPWPLYLVSQTDNDFDPVTIFNTDGTLTDDFLAFIGAPVVTRPATVTQPCGCFFEGRTFHASPSCEEHAEESDECEA